MAQIASLTPPAQPARISQLLPTVKCSNCSQPVPLAELGDHVCPQQQRPSNTLLSLQKSPNSTIALLPQRLQNLVPNRAATPQQQITRTPSPHAPPSKPSQHDPFQRLPPTVNYNKGATRINSPSIPASSRTPPPQSILLNGGTSTRSHVQFPAQTTPMRVTTPPVAVKIPSPSNAGTTGHNSTLSVTSFPNPFDVDTRQPGASTHITARPRAASSSRRENTPVVPQVSLPSSVIPRTRTPSNAPPHNSIVPLNLTPHPSFDRTRAPSAPAPRPSFDKSRPSFDALPIPSFDTRHPSFDVPRPQPPAHVQRPSFDVPHSSIDRTLAGLAQALPPAPVPRPPRGSATVPPLAGVPFLSRASTPQPPPPPPTHAPLSDGERNIDTKSGGEAGMAGVGRRGFAAAARAAMFAGSLAHSNPSHHTDTSLVMDGRRANAPKYLDINATMNHVLRAAMTPPLSPNSGRSHSPVSPQPVSPLSPALSTALNIGQFPKIPLSTPRDISRGQHHSLSPNQKVVPLSSPPADVQIVSSSRTPSPISNPFTRHFSGETVTQSPFSPVAVRLPFLDTFDSASLNDSEDDSDEESVYTTHTIEPRRRSDAGLKSPSTDTEAGLAYADDSDDDTPVVMPLDIRKSNTSGMNNVKFPSVEGGQPHSTVRKLPSRNVSASSTASSSTSRIFGLGSSRTRSASAATQMTTRSVGALERAMETLIEEGASVSVLASGSVLASLTGPSGRGVSGKPNRSNTVAGPVSPENKPPKLPARSHTSPHHPHIHSERVGVTGEVARIRGRGREKKGRMCASCDKKVEDGRWIQMDGGNVLCERCWKNMYLPKCRRCNLPIEKQAVSSSDGQLKGKYHRDCFNCHICQKPFPDKEFYVFDGKPLCAYHYHEANDSLCAAVSCGQPIEGPCAVTHAGKRYHPEHLLCEFENGCGERLAEYWEVDGQMFCEKHAPLAGGSCASSLRGESPDGRRARDEGRAMRRMTRFIDLGALEDEGL